MIVTEPGGRSSIELVTWAFDASNACEVSKRAYNKRNNREFWAYLETKASPSPIVKEGETVPEDNKCHVFYKGTLWRIS